MFIPHLLCLALATYSPEADTAKATKSTDSIRVTHARQIVVTGTRNEIRLKDSPVRVEVIGKEKIAGTAMANLGDLLKEQTGLQLQGGVRTGVQMNGLSPDYTLILIDGQPVIGRVAGVIDLQRLSVGNIERVEVVKGPMSSMYGSEALAGVINIITKRPTDGISGSVTLQAINKGAQEIRCEGAVADSLLELSAFINAKHSPAFALQSDSTQFPYASFSDATLQIKAQYLVSKYLKLKSWVRGFGTKTSGAFIESVLGQVAANTGSVLQYDISNTLSAEYLKDNSRLTLSAYSSFYSERYNFDVQQGNAGSNDDLLRRNLRLFTQYDFLVTLNDRITAGAEFLYDDIRGSRYADSTNANYQPFYRTAVGFAQWESKLDDSFMYVVSGRFDNNNVFGSAFSPRLSLLYRPGDHFRASGSVGTGFKAPDFRQLFVAFSNRLPGANYDLIGAQRVGVNLQPERCLTFEAGIRYEDGQRELSSQASLLYSAEIRGFRNSITNLIEFYLYGTINNRNIYSYRNLASAYTQGFEMNFNLVLALADFGNFGITSGYQFLDAADNQVLDAIDNKQAGTIDNVLTRSDYGGLWNRSRNSGTLRLQYTSLQSDWSANIRFQFVGKYGDESLDKNGFVISNPARKVLDNPDEYVNGYTVVNLGVSKTFSLENSPTKYLLSTGINNVCNVSNPMLIPGLVGTQFFVQAAVTF